MAATAPTLAAQGTASFCAPAKLKILLVPATPLEGAEFERWASFVRNVDCVRLRDVPRAKASVFPSSPLYQQGEVHVSFVTSYDPAHAYLAPLQLHRQVLGVLGLTTYDARAAASQELPRVAGLLRAEHPHALVHRVFAFDVDARDGARAGDGDLGVAADAPSGDFQPSAAGFAGRRDGGLFVFPAVRADAKDVRFYLRTQLAELVGAVLDQLDTVVGALEGTALETPRETLRDGVSPALRAALQRSAAGRAPALDGAPLPPRAPPPPPGAGTPPPGAASKVFGALSKRRGSAAPAAPAPPTAGPHGTTRHTKVRADVALLSGDLWAALELYDALLTPQARERALAGGQDAVWFASALEGWAVARMLVARLGGAAHDEAPCLAYPLQPAARDKERDAREPVIPALAWKDIAEAYALALAVYAKCLAPPHVQLESLRSVTSDTPRDYTPPLVHAGACLAYARFLLAVWASGGWNGEAFDQMLFGGTPPALVRGAPRHTELSAHSGVYRDEIARAACAALSPALRTLPPADEIAALSAVAKLLGLVGYARRRAHVVRQLHGVVSALLARSFRARGAAPPPPLAVETLVHEALRVRIAPADTRLGVAHEAAGVHDTMNPALVLGLMACDTYGIDLLSSPVRHVPATHILERARRRVVAEEYASVLDAVLGEAPAARTLLPALAQSAAAARMPKPPFGWGPLQVQLLKDLVVQSEALADYVSMTYFATLLLRDYAAALAPTEHAALLDGLRRVLPRARESAPQLTLRYWGPKTLLAALEIVPPAPALRPVVRTRTSLDPPPEPGAPPPPAGTHNPFFWNTPRTAKPAAAPTLVAHEPCTVRATLRNPLGVPLPLERLALRVAGVDADTPAIRTLVPAHALHTVELRATPRAAGTLEVLGCTAVLWGAEAHDLDVGAPPAAPPAPKATGLDARHSATLVARVAHAAAGTRDEPWTGAAVDRVLAPHAPRAPASCPVAPPLPLLDAALPTLDRAALALHDGEVTTLPLRLTNRTARAVDYVRVELDDSLQAPTRAAIADGGLLAGDVHELEWQLLCHPVLALGTDVRALRIAPHASATVPLVVRAKAACTWASVRVLYGAPPPDAASLTLRAVHRAIPMTVRPSVVCRPLALAPLDAAGAARLATQLGADAPPPPLGPSCLLSLDLYNASPRPLHAEVDAEAAPGVALRATRAVLPQSTVRIHVPLAQRALAAATLQTPIPKLSPRQFVVGKTPLSPAMQAACNAQFWVRDALLRSVRASWHDAARDVRGDISLREYWPSVDDVRVLSQPKVHVALHLAHDPAPEALVEVRVAVTNHTDSPLRLRVHLAPAPGAPLDDTHAAEYAASQVLVADGSWTSAVHPSPLAPGAATHTRKTLCFLSAGHFVLHATAEVMPDSPDTPATVFVGTPLPVHVVAP